MFIDQYFDIAIFQSRQEKTSDLSGRGDLIGKDCSGRDIIGLGKLDKLNRKAVVDGWRHKPNVTWFEFSDVHRRSCIPHHRKSKTFQQRHDSKMGWCPKWSEKQVDFIISNQLLINPHVIRAV